MAYNFIKKAKEIYIRDKPVFDTLIEFENSRKIRTKKRMNFTIDKNIAEKFKKYCKENGYNMISLVEKEIKKIIEKNK